MVSQAELPWATAQAKPEPKPKLDHAPYEDRKGQALHPGDRVSFKLYPRGTAKGIVVISERAQAMVGDGSFAPALSIQRDGVVGTLYSMPSPRGVLKLKKQS